MAFLQTGIRNYVQTNVPTIRLTASVDESVKALRASSYGAVYTIDDGGKLAGVITFCDLDKLADPEQKPKTAGELATREKVIAVRETAELWQLLKIMNGENAVSKRLDRIPVVDEANHPVGIVERNSLRSALSSIQIPVSGNAMI